MEEWSLITSNFIVAIIPFPHSLLSSTKFLGFPKSESKVVIYRGFEQQKVISQMKNRKFISKNAGFLAGGHKLLSKSKFSGRTIVFPGTSATPFFGPPKDGLHVFFGIDTHLDVTELTLGSLSPPQAGLPHVTTVPSARTAAKALHVAQICWTSFRWSWTAVLSPPKLRLPHVTTVPSAKMAAKACFVYSMYLANFPQLNLDWCAVTTMDCPMSPLIHQTTWRQMPPMWHVFGERSSADLGLLCCHHHRQHCPMSPLIHQPTSQQKPCLWHISGERSSADLGLLCCHHHRQHCPMPPLIHQPTSQQKPCLWHISGERSSADLGLLCCHHHSLDCPMSPRFRLPKWQQKHALCMYLANFPQLILDWCAVTTIVKSGLPHVTTDPSNNMAANASHVACIWRTFFSWSWTAVLSPPQSGLPHVTTVPSTKMAAKALCVAQICRTPFNWSWTAVLSPP